MTQPQDGVGPNEAEEYLRRLARESADQVLKGYQAFLIEDIMPKMINKVVEQVVPLIPTHEGVVKEAADVLNAKADNGLSEIRQRIVQVEAAIASNGAHGQPQQIQVQQGSNRSAIPIRFGGNTLDINGIIDAIFDKGTKLVELFALMNNPFSMRDKIAAQNPSLLPMYAFAFAPPTQEQILMAQRMLAEGMSTGLKTRVEAFKGLRQWDTTPSGGSPNSNPAWYGGSSRDPSSPQTSPPPQNGAQPQGSATMTNSGSGPETRDGVQDTVRVSERPSSRQNRPVGLKGNYR